VGVVGKAAFQLILRGCEPGLFGLGQGLHALTRKAKSNGSHACYLF
jgi:hypothetical protein